MGILFIIVMEELGGVEDHRNALYFKGEERHPPPPSSAAHQVTGSDLGNSEGLTPVV